MNTKNNQRYIETENRIITVTQDLIAEQGIRQTTVSEICRRAGINRKSFYLHFPDVEAVLVRLETIKGEELAQRLGQISPADLKSSLEGLFEFCKEDRAFYKPFLTSRHSCAFAKPMLDDLLDSESDGILPKCKGLDEVACAYHEAFFKSGVFSVLSLWMERDCQESPEYMAEILVREYQATF